MDDVVREVLSLELERLGRWFEVYVEEVEKHSEEVEKHSAKLAEAELAVSDTRAKIASIHKALGVAYIYEARQEEVGAGDGIE